MKQIFMVIITLLLLISKTIEDPIYLNLSPADVLWPFVALMFAWKFLKRSDFRKQISENPDWLTMIGLFFWGLAVSVMNGIYNVPGDMTSQAFFKSLIVNNLKGLLITGYYTLGLWACENSKHKVLQNFAWSSTLLFSVVGLKAFFMGTPEWALSGRRIISSVNDPNMAAWVCLLGLLFVWASVSGTVGLRFKWKRRLLQGLAMLSVPVFILTLLMTGSRTGLAGLLLLAFMYLCSQARDWRRALLILSATLLLGAGLIRFDHEVFKDEVYTQISNRVFNGSERASDFRGLLRNAALDIGMAHPVIGVGPGQFPNFSTPYYEYLGEDTTTEYFKTNIAPKVPHNTYVTFFAERGVVGAVLFLLLIGFGLKRAQSGPEYSFVGLIMLYSMFFNIENIRFIWFLWGGLCIFRPIASDPVEIEEMKDKIWKQPLLLIAVFITSSAFFFDAVGSLYRTGVELNGQTTEFTVLEGGLDIKLQTYGSQKDPLFISLDGPENRSVIIRNAYGFYQEHYDLVPGIYTVTLKSGSMTRTLLHMQLTSGDTNLYINGDLLRANKLNGWAMDDTFESFFIMDKIENNAIYEPVEYEKLSTKYIHKSTGINFENQINLVASSLTSLDEPGQYQMTWTFEKTGAIEYPYMLLARAYDLRDSRRGHAKNLAQNIVFDPPLTELEIGETFTASWTFDTEESPYMMQYGFYYWDKEAERTYQPYPKWVRQGYVQ